MRRARFRNEPLFYMLGFIFISVLSVLNYYWYKWWEVPVIGFFAATDDSVFQSIKLIFYPWLFYLVVFDSEHLCGGVIGLLFSGLLIPSGHYTADALGYTELWYVTLLLSILAGVLLWMSASELRHVIFPSLILIALIIWFTTCSYSHCQGEIYRTV